MRVLLVNTVPTDRNGITKVIENLARHMDRQDLQLDYLSVKTLEEACLRVVTDRGGKVFEIPRSIRGAIGYVVKLARLVRRQGYDIVHAHGNSSTLALEMVAAWLGGCRVRMAHSHNTTCTYMTAHKVLKPLFRLLCTHRLACGEDAGKWLYGKRDFTAVNNGIDTAAFGFDGETRQQLRKHSGVGEEEILLGHVGVFNEAKNQQYLLDILSRLDRKYRLLLVGDGPLMETVREKAEKLGIADRVMFAGSTDRVAGHLSACDLFVMPSRYEGLPLTLIEAQVSGLHCLVADTVTKEVDKTGNVQFLPLDNREMWIYAIDNFQFAKNREEISRRSQEKIAAAGYDIAGEAARLKAYYENAIKG